MDWMTCIQFKVRTGIFLSATMSRLALGWLNFLMRIRVSFPGWWSGNIVNVCVCEAWHPLCHMVWHVSTKTTFCFYFGNYKTLPLSQKYCRIIKFNIYIHVAKLITSIAFKTHKYVENATFFSCVLQLENHNYYSKSVS
jgi:hypothetical protein